jgi:CRP-like cAMP-binding protein
MESKECVLPTFGALTEDQINRINANSYLVKHRKDEMIFRQNTPVSYIQFIQTGLVKLFREGGNEKKVILQIAPPNSFIGMLSVFYDTRYQYSATVIEESKVIYTNFSTFLDIIAENGKYATFLMKLISGDAMHLLDKLINVSQKQVTGRVAEVLLFFSQDIYNNNTYTLPVTRQELAELVSSTKESISRTLTEFKNDRIIEIDDKKVIIKTPDLLQILSKLG